jgi:hypothetical protein
MRLSTSLARRPSLTILDGLTRFLNIRRRSGKKPQASVAIGDYGAEWLVDLVGNRG